MKPDPDTERIDPDQSVDSKQVSHLLMMSTNAVKERDKRENPCRKKSMGINSDLGEIFEAR